MVENTIGQLIQKYSTILKNKNIDNPILEAQLLLANILEVEKLYVMTNYLKEVPKHIIEKFETDVELRCGNMPIQYIIGSQEFMSMQFNVNSSVLIPRPDTEILVEEVIRNYNKDSEYNILELGTGSGCIAISLAKIFDNSIVHAVDISIDALKIAQKNAMLNYVESKIKFYNGNLFEPIGESHNYFDILVSNPPYIPKMIIESLNSNVRDYEPRIALDGGDDGLDFYRIICKESKNYLKKSGMIFLEIGYDQAKNVKELLKINNFDDIYVVKDLSGNDRVVTAKNAN